MDFDSKMQLVENFSACFLQVLKCVCAEDVARFFVGDSEDEPASPFIRECDTVTHQFCLIELLPRCFEFQMSTFVSF